MQGADRANCVASDMELWYKSQARAWQFSTHGGLTDKVVQSLCMMQDGPRLLMHVSGESLWIQPATSIALLMRCAERLGFRPRTATLMQHTLSAYMLVLIDGPWTE